MVKSQYTYISGKGLIKKLDAFHGIQIVGQKGSHIKIQSNVHSKKTIVPNHKELAYGTVSAILRQMQVDESDFFESF